MTHPSGAGYEHRPAWLDRAKRAEGGAAPEMLNEGAISQISEPDAKGDKVQTVVRPPETGEVVNHLEPIEHLPPRSNLLPRAPLMRWGRSKIV